MLRNHLSYKTYNHTITTEGRKMRRRSAIILLCCSAQEDRNENPLGCASLKRGQVSAPVEKDGVT